MRKALIAMAICASIGVLMAELGSNVPTDNQLTARRAQEGGSAGLECSISQHRLREPPCDRFSGSRATSSASWAHFH